MWQFLDYEYNNAIETQILVKLLYFFGPFVVDINIKIVSFAYDQTRCIELDSKQEATQPIDTDVFNHH
jgi:hypothetical protein